MCRRFVSHWWGDAVADVVTCLLSHSFDRAVDREHAFYWVAAYAIRQWVTEYLVPIPGSWPPESSAEIKIELGTRPRQSPLDSAFARAMMQCEGTVAVVDSSGGFFRRAWCYYETHLAFTQRG